MKAHRILFAWAAALSLNGCELIEEEDTDPPILFNVGVDLAAYDPLTRTAGAFVLDTGLSSIFSEFGAEIPSFGWAYVLSTGADVVSPLAGKVSSLSFDESDQTYTVRIRPKSDSVWSVIVSHVALPVVEDDMPLAAGDPLGVAGPGAPLGYSQLTLRIDDTKKDKAWCPLALFDSATLLTVSSSLSAALAQFETLEGNPNIYDESAWVLPGCTSETVPY